MVTIKIAIFCRNREDEVKKYFNNNITTHLSDSSRYNRDALL